MTTYVQTTIHSKVAKFEKTSAEGYGTLLRGRITRTRPSPNDASVDASHEMQMQIEALPKVKGKQSAPEKARVKLNEAVLMESAIFPAVYFKKTTMRNVLKEFAFPQEVRAVAGEDEKVPLLFQIVSNLFSEINFFIFNILVGNNTISDAFYVFFSDSETIPYTKCCNAPVYVELLPNGSGRLLCNSLKCPHSSIAEFLVNFEDARKLWKNIAYFSQASNKDKLLRTRISRMIGNGRFKQHSLVGIVQETSREIVDLFYSSKPTEPHPETETPFLTATQTQPHLPPKQSAHEMSPEEIMSPEETNVDMLKMKVDFITKKHKDFVGKAANQLINEGKVFHKNFEIIKKIDDFMLTKKDGSAQANLSFPRLMDRMRRTNLPRLNRTVDQQNSFH